MAVPEGFEPSTLGVEIPCSIQLSYGTIGARRRIRTADLLITNQLLYHLS